MLTHSLTHTHTHTSRLQPSLAVDNMPVSEGGGGLSRWSSARMFISIRRYYAPALPPPTPRYVTYTVVCSLVLKYLQPGTKIPTRPGNLECGGGGRRGGSLIQRKRTRRTRGAEGGAEKEARGWQQLQRKKAR